MPQKKRQEPKVGVKSKAGLEKKIARIKDNRTIKRVRESRLKASSAIRNPSDNDMVIKAAAIATGALDGEEAAARAIEQAGVTAVSTDAAITAKVDALTAFHGAGGLFYIHVFARWLHFALAYADSVHDFIAGFRGLKQKDKRGVIYAREYLRRILEAEAGRVGAPPEYKTIIKDVITRSIYNIEAAIKIYIETKANVPWVSAIDTNARITYDDILDSIPTEAQAAAYGIELRQQYDAIELYPGEKTVSTLNTDQRKRIGFFMNAFLFGAAEAESYFTCDSAPKEVRKLLEGLPNIHGLITPQNIADSATTSLNKPLSKYAPDVFMFPYTTPETRSNFTSTANTFNNTDLDVVFVNGGAGGFSQQTPFNWEYRINSSAVPPVPPVPGWNNTSVRYGPGYGNEGPSVNQLLELQMKVSTAESAVAATAAMRAVVPDKGTQVAVGDLFSPNAEWIRHRIGAVAGVPIAPGHGSILMGIKLGGDRDQCYSVTSARRLLTNVCLISGDPTACLMNRLLDNPTIEQWNDRVRIFKSNVTERPLTPAEIEEIRRKKIYRDLQQLIKIVTEACSVDGGATVSRLSRLLDTINTEFQRKFDSESDPLKKYLLYVKQTDISNYFSAAKTLRFTNVGGINICAGLNDYIIAWNAHKEAIRTAQGALHTVTRARPINLEAIREQKQILSGLRAQNIIKEVAERQAAATGVLPDIIRNLKSLTSMVEQHISTHIGRDPTELTEVINLDYDPRPFNADRAYPTLNYYPSKISKIADNYHTVQRWMLGTAGAAPEHILDMIIDYNKDLEIFCGGLFIQEPVAVGGAGAPALPPTDGHTVYNNSVIGFRGAALGRGGLVYVNNINAENEGEEGKIIPSQFQTYVDAGLLAGADIPILERFNTAFTNFKIASRATRGGFRVEFMAAAAAMLAITSMPAGFEQDRTGNSMYKQKGGAYPDDSLYLEDKLGQYFAEMAAYINGILIDIPHLHLIYRALNLRNLEAQRNPINERYITDISMGFNTDLAAYIMDPPGNLTIDTLIGAIGNPAIIPSFFDIMSKIVGADNALALAAQATERISSYRYDVVIAPDGTVTNYGTVVDGAAVRYSDKLIDNLIGEYPLLDEFNNPTQIDIIFNDLRQYLRTFHPEEGSDIFRLLSLGFMFDIISNPSQSPALFGRADAPPLQKRVSYFDILLPGVSIQNFDISTQSGLKIINILTQLRIAFRQADPVKVLNKPELRALIIRGGARYSATRRRSRKD